MEKIKIYTKDNYKIELETFNNTFVVYEEKEGNWDNLKEFRKYDDAINYINNREKRKSEGKIKKKEPYPILIGSVSWRLNTKKAGEEAKITSISIDGTSMHIWVSTDKQREKTTLYDFYKVTEENKKLFEEIEKKEKEITELKSKREIVTEAELKEYFAGDIDSNE